VKTMDDTMEQIIYILKEMQNDNTVSKNVKSKVAEMQKNLENSKEEELSLKVNKILSDLEDISSDVNIPTFVRTQMWHLTSLLENLS